METRQTVAPDVRVLPAGPLPGRPWVVWPALLGPVAFVTAWSVSGALQPPAYDAVQQSVSELAVGSATQPWIMTLGLYLIAACQLLTAAGLTQMRRGPRAFLVAGGIAGLGVAWFPQPEHGPTATSAHIVCATACIVSLAVWPAAVKAYGFHRFDPVGGRAVAAATVLLLVLLGWVFVAGHGGGALGVAERVEISVASLWPLVVVLAARRRAPVRA